MLNLRNTNNLDKEALFSWLSNDLFSVKHDQETFNNWFENNKNNLKVIIYQNLRIGFILGENIFIKPQYWKFNLLSDIKKLLRN